MNVKFASIGTPGRRSAAGDIAESYRERCGAYAEVEVVVFRSEGALLASLEGSRRRTAPLLVLLDGRGKMFSSEQFADWLGRQSDCGQQAILFAIGPADGWSDAARARAGMLLSFGPMTFPHELMRVVLAEQVYRAFTILAGHPYHSGHRG